MNSNLTYIERGELPPLTRPVADLTQNPYRTYSATEPSTIEGIAASF